MEIAWLRKCKDCGDEFLVCRRCGFNRRYCEKCAKAAEQRRVREARRNYRSSDEGKQQHRDEERKRRRERRERERVGDRLSAGAAGRVSVGAVGAPETVAVAAASSQRLAGAALPGPPVPVGRQPAGQEAASRITAAGAASGARDHGAAHPPLARWRLVVSQALAGRAQALRRSGKLVRCVGCGRWGRVVQVVVKGKLWAGGAEAARPLRR